MEFYGLMNNNADSVQMVVNYLFYGGHTEIGYLKGN
jgi:DNA-binding LacI/PurR family transcriptional regulator